MTLKVVVVLLAVALVVRRLAPRRRLPWAVPAVLVVVVLAVRTATWLTGD